MATLNNFNPLRVAKRKLRPYAAVPNQDPDEEQYLEKRRSSESAGYSCSDSSPSSRSSSGAYAPMLRHSPPPRWRTRLPVTCGPRRFSRYVGLLVGLALILFIMNLIRMGWSSARSVRLGSITNSPPPAWESFPFLKRYHGGIRTLVSRKENTPEYPSAEVEGDIPQVQSPSPHVRARNEGASVPPSVTFDPYPGYNSKTYQSEYGKVEPCYLDENKKIIVPKLRAYSGVVEGMPDNVIGSYDLLGLRNDVCFERFGRLGPYGLGYSRKLGGTGAAMEGDREGATDVWQDDPEVDFSDVKWASVQEKCIQANKHRFKPQPEGRNNFFQTMAVGGPHSESLMDKPKKVERRADSKGPDKTTSSAQAKKLLPRTAVIIRTWWDYQYDDEDLIYLRALISELSIQSGGEYSVHFLIHVKDDNMQIWADDEVYQSVLDKALPEEFHGMGTLWSERQMGLVYGGLEESFYRNLPVHGAYRSTYMPVQYFAHQHPEYDFFWQWEMDVRYTGHFYHLFEQVGKWASQQPRKLLWERSSRFYVPSEHGSWEEFMHMVRVHTEHGTNSKNNVWAKNLDTNMDLATPAQPAVQPDKPIWGPERPLDDELETENDPEPPTSFKEDDYSWGVGEDADLITFNPLFDPQGTNWILAEDVTGYNKSRSLPPRRTAIVTASRLSRRLLETMHRETAHKRHTMFSEMWPASCALHHGLKAVYAPHPVFIDRRWPTGYLAAIFNGGKNGAAGGGRFSVFSDERQHNFRGTTWYYDAGFAPNLWKRWLGYRVDNDGGEEWELANEGRMCLPGMLLHPVKQVDLIFEHRAEE